jgi:TolB-like protein
MSDQSEVSDRLALGEIRDAAAGAAGPQAESAEKRARKKNKVRSAWISFVGRIVAQFIGASATIFLGLMVLQKYQAVRPEAAATAPGAAPAIEQRGIPARARGGEAQVSLAVLPLVSFSPNSRHDQFANALTEGLITALSQLPDLRVISRTSSMVYKDLRKPLPEIGRELGADLIVEGSIAKVGDRVRVIAQLINVETDEHLWTATYDRQFRDLLSFQEEVSAQIARDVNIARMRKPGSKREPPPNGAERDPRPLTGSRE